MAAPLRNICCRSLLKQNCFVSRKFHTILPRAAFSHTGAESTSESSSLPSYNESSVQQKIEIPRRKKRSSTAILEALASTVNRDLGAPHHKYIDDPYLIPASVVEKRVYSLSKAAGKKAARYVVDTYPGNFMDNPADPVIKDFMPPEGLKFPDNEESGLRERIKSRMVTAAYQSYQKIKEHGSRVSEELTTELLELLCMYNSADCPPDMLPDERFYARATGQDHSRRIVKTWRDTGAAELLFKEMENPSRRAYASMIRGRAKYFQVDRAYELYREMKSKQLPVDLKTYNSVLTTVFFLKDTAESRWQMIQELLQEMADDGVTPDLETYNNILYCLSRLLRYRESAIWALETITEMKRCGIEPSLASWTYAIKTMYAKDEHQSNLLSEITEYLQGKRLTVRDPADYDFFHTAMFKNYTNVQDLELAYKLDTLAQEGENYKLLGDGYKEGLYYTHYLRTICMFEQIDTIMDHYEQITPHVYTPTFGVLSDLLTAIELNDGQRYLPKIWSDLVLFDYSRRVDLIEKILGAMAAKPQPPELQEQFVKVVDGIKERHEDDRNNARLVRPLELSGLMFGAMIQVNLNSDRFEEAWQLFEFYLKDKNRIQGFLSEGCLVKLSDACIVRKDISKTMQVLTSLGDFGYPAIDKVAEKAQAELELTQEQKNYIEDLL